GEPVIDGKRRAAEPARHFDGQVGTAERRPDNEAAAVEVQHRRLGGAAVDGQRQGADSADGHLALSHVRRVRLDDERLEPLPVLLGGLVKVEAPCAHCRVEGVPLCLAHRGLLYTCRLRAGPGSIDSSESTSTELDSQESNSRETGLVGTWTSGSGSSSSSAPRRGCTTRLTAGCARRTALVPGSTRS